MESLLRVAAPPSFSHSPASYFTLMSSSHTLMPATILCIHWSLSNLSLFPVECEVLEIRDMAPLTHFFIPRDQSRVWHIACAQWGAVEWCSDFGFILFWPIAWWPRWHMGVPSATTPDPRNCPTSLKTVPPPWCFGKSLPSLNVSPEA